jgi:hypothetical protein
VVESLSTFLPVLFDIPTSDIPQAIRNVEMAIGCVHIQVISTWNFFILGFIYSSTGIILSAGALGL